MPATGSDHRAGAAEQPGGGQSLLTWRRPPLLEASGPDTLSLARLTATRTRWKELEARSDRRTVSTDTLPFLTRTPEGRAFLASPPPRALARGVPAESCPATVVHEPGPGTTLADLVEGALRRCLAVLRPAHPACGCEVMAVNDLLTVPAEEMAFATGTAARIRVPGLGIDTMLIADSDPAGETLRDVSGPVARIDRNPGDGVRISFLQSGRVFRGESFRVGYRRGRVAERIYATDAAGDRMSLLIGFSPDELAEGAARYLAWPADMAAEPRLAGG